MRHTLDKYETPEAEVLAVDLALPVAASPLENPEEGDIWSWD